MNAYLSACVCVAFAVCVFIRMHTYTHVCLHVQMFAVIVCCCLIWWSNLPPIDLCNKKRNRLLTRSPLNLTLRAKLDHRAALISGSNYHTVSNSRDPKRACLVESDQAIGGRKLMGANYNQAGSNRAGFKRRQWINNVSPFLTKRNLPTGIALIKKGHLL